MIQKKPTPRAIPTILFLFALFLLISNANAVTFTDDFSSYGNYIKIISQTDTNAPWVAELDSRYVWNDTNYLKFGIGGLKVWKDHDFTTDARSSIGYNPFPTVDLSDYNANGVMHYWFKLDGNASNVWRADVRIGADSTHYYSYAMVATPSFSPGYNLASWDMNCTGNTVCFVPAGGGSTFESTKYLDLAVHNELDGNTSGSDFNITWNLVWVEKSLNAFNGAWRVYDGATIRGHAIPYYDTVGGNWSLMIGTMDTTGGGVNAFTTKWMVPSLDATNLQDYNVHISASVKIPYAQNGINVGKATSTKLVFDYNSMSFYSAIFVNDLNTTHKTIGLEQVVNGTRNHWDVNVLYAFNEYHLLKSDINGTNASLFMDGVRVLDTTIVSRMDGNVGIIQVSGTGMVKNYSVEFNNIGTFTSEISPATSEKINLGNGNSSIGMSLFNMLFALILLCFLAVLMIAGLKAGDPSMIIFGAIVVALIYVVWNALFF